MQSTRVDKFEYDPNSEAVFTTAIRSPFSVQTNKNEFEAVAISPLIFFN